MIAKPDADNMVTALYGMDVKFANLMSSPNIRVTARNLLLAGDS